VLTTQGSSQRVADIVGALSGVAHDRAVACVVTVVSVFCIGESAFESEDGPPVVVPPGARGVNYAETVVTAATASAIVAATASGWETLMACEAPATSRVPREEALSAPTRCTATGMLRS